VLKFNKKKEELFIIDKKTGKEVVFTATRLAFFHQCMDEVDEQLNMMSQSKTWPIATVTEAVGTFR